MPVLPTVYAENRKEPYGIKSYIFLCINNQKDTFSCIIMLPTKHTKEGVLNEKLALKKLLTYITSVYKIPQKIKCLSDKRKRKSIPLFNIVMPVLLFLMLQYESFHTVFSAPESMSKRLRNVAGEREGSGEMDVAGNNAGTDSPGDLMGDDEPQVGYRREWVPPAEDVLLCKALLLPCGGRSYI